LPFQTAEVNPLPVDQGLEQLGHATWLATLKQEWARLLPGVEFPHHTLGSHENTTLGYSTSPARPTPVVFENAALKWSERPAMDLQVLVLDNDIRALFYEIFAKQLQAILSDSRDAERLTVRYIGGCLRSPMLLTRARMFLGRFTAAEAILQQDWQAVAARTFPVRLPFWGTPTSRSRWTPTAMSCRAWTSRPPARWPASSWVPATRFRGCFVSKA